MEKSCANLVLAATATLQDEMPRQGLHSFFPYFFFGSPRTVLFIFELLVVLVGTFHLGLPLVMASDDLCIPQIAEGNNHPTPTQTIVSPHPPLGHAASPTDNQDTSETPALQAPRSPTLSATH